MSVKVGQSLTFEPEIPESNNTKLAGKFIPMQLRTQPSNLGIGQLQRVNTTLLGDISGTQYTYIFFVVVALLFYVHGKHLRSCRDGQLT